MERRRNLLDNLNHFKGKINVETFNFGFNNVGSALDLNYSIQPNQVNNEFDFKYDFNLTSLQGAFIVTTATTLEITELDTSLVTNMSVMFVANKQLTSLVIPTFNTSQVTTMAGMFSNCPHLTSLDVSHFNTSNVLDMSNMFSLCSNLLTLDLSNFDTSNVTDMHVMFQDCNGLTSLDLSHFDTSNVTNMNSMFENCNNLDSITTNMRFQQWCIDNAETIKLPLKFRNSTYQGWILIADNIPKD